VRDAATAVIAGRGMVGFSHNKLKIQRFGVWHRFCFTVVVAASKPFAVAIADREKSGPATAVRS